MQSMFYGFILNMWMMNKIDEAQVQAYVPKYITQEEADAIMLVPQTGTVQAQKA
jgi:hypothetical protein